MSSEISEGAIRTARTVTIPYSDLKDRSLDLSRKIEDGFGPNGLGIISVSDVPRFSSLRENLLHLSPRFASLPESAKKGIEDANSRYNFGWSHGKEKLDFGKPDTSKGSFYANPIIDVPTTEASLIQRYPSYCRPNIWPTDDLPEFEEAFKALGKLMLDVGLHLAYHCDQYVSKAAPMLNDDRLENILGQSRCHKGRLLYYFPKQHSELVTDVHNLPSWCGWHTDHGSLTGLTCAIFMRNAVKIPCPSGAGLHVKTRSNHIIKIVFGEDEIAYQIGETTEVLSGGYLCATPHCVMAPRGDEALGVDRSSFALFMQPDWDAKLNFPENVHLHEGFIHSNGGLAFGEYTESLLNEYYHRLS